MAVFLYYAYIQGDPKMLCMIILTSNYWTHFQRCIPEFENAAFSMEMEATNTCGMDGEQEYCVQTGVTGIRKSCVKCYTGQHHARYMTDLHNIDNPTWWQSETMLEGIQWPNQVNLTLRFGMTFKQKHW